MSAPSFLQPIESIQTCSSDNCGPFSEVPRETTLQIFGYLDSQTMGGLQLVSKNIKALTIPTFFCDLLKRDFGEPIAGRFKPEECQKAYFHLSAMLKKFIRSLPRSELLSVSTDNNSARIYGPWVQSNFDDYIAHLSEKELNDVFSKSVEFEYIPLMLALMNDPRLTLESLKNGLMAAAKAGKTESIKLIINHPRFPEIPINDQYGFADAFKWAAEMGQTEAMEHMMRSSFFDQISLSGPFGLGHALIRATVKGQLKAMLLLIRCEKFKQVPATGQFGIGDAFIRAAANGSIFEMLLIMSCNQFSQVNSGEVFGLRRAFELAERNNQTMALRLILSIAPFIQSNQDSTTFGPETKMLV